MRLLWCRVVRIATTAKWGGNATGLNLRTSNYTRNALNHYTRVTTPGWASISGAAWATTKVTVNGGTTDRKGEFFHREISVANSGGPVWTEVTVDPQPPSGTPTDLLHPHSTQSYTYDEDGNLAFDDIWTYEWDAENRLKTSSWNTSEGSVLGQSWVSS